MAKSCVNSLVVFSPLAGFQGDTKLELGAMPTAYLRHHSGPPGLGQYTRPSTLADGPVFGVNYIEFLQLLQRYWVWQQNQGR